MARSTSSIYEHAVDTTSAWVADVADALGTDDQRLSYRVVRAWLHTLRDRLTVDAAAQFASQLPELLRGAFFEGWEPAWVPLKYGREEYVARFVSQSRVPADAAADTIANVTEVLQRHMSPGQMTHVLVQLPHPLRSLLIGSEPEDPAPVARAPVQRQAPSGEGPVDWLPDRVERLEAQLEVLREAVVVLTRSMEQLPGGVPDDDAVARAARLAHELVMTQPE